MADIIKLNVGDCIYTTSRSTLTRYPNSMLGGMFSGYIPTTTDKDGNYWIDGNGDMFRFVLDFLRRGSLLLPELFQEFDLLEKEADFYQIPELIQSVAAQKLSKLENKKKAGAMQYIVLEYFWDCVLSNITGRRISEVNISGPKHVLEQLHLSLSLQSGVNLKQSGHNIRISPYSTTKYPQSALAQEILNLGYELYNKPDYYDTDSKGSNHPQQWFVKTQK